MERRKPSGNSALFGTPNFFGKVFNFLMEASERQLGASQRLGVGFVALLGVAAFGFFALTGDFTALFGEIEPSCGEPTSGFALKIGQRCG